MNFAIPNPSTRQHSQTNRNDVSGTIFASKNIDLDDENSIRLAPPSVAVMTTDDDAEFDTADAMNTGNGRIYVLSEEVFSGDVDVDVLNNLSTDTDVPTPGTEDDTVYFNDTQVVSDGTTVRYISSSDTWSTISGLTITGSAPTVLGVFDGQNGLMIGHGNRVDLVDTSWTLDDTLVLPEEYQVSSVVSDGATGYIGTRHDATGEARVFLWDGSASSASASYGIENFEIASLKTGFSSVIAVASDGRLMRFNGGGFDELAVLPVYMTDEVYGDELNDYSKISNRGLVVDGNQAFVMCASQLESSRRYLPHMPGGVWCYDPAVGFYHRFSPSLTTVTKDTILTGDIDTATNEITVASAPATGTPALFAPTLNTPADGLRQGVAYYVINVDSTTIKLAETYADALAGSEVNITSTGSNTQFLVFYETFDYGQQYLDNRSAVVLLGNTARDARFAGRLAYTADLFDETITEKTALCTYVRQLPNRGYFITPKLYAQAKDGKYNAVFVRHDDLGDEDAIILKYRVSRSRNYPVDLTNYTNSSVSTIAGTWTDTDTFTTTQDLSNVKVGDEVEIVGGKGSGFMSHVASISEASGTYTVNLDEGFAFASNGEQFIFLVDDWKKLGTITKDSLDGQFRIDDVGGYLQLKVELRGIQTRVIDVLINGESYRELI